MEMLPPAGEPVCLIAVQPVVHGIWVPSLQQPADGDGMRAHALRDFQQGGSPFTHLGMRIVIPALLQLVSSMLGEFQRATSDHDRPPGGDTSSFHYRSLQ